MRSSIFSGTCGLVQEHLRVSGRVNLKVSPFEDFANRFAEFWRLINNHQTYYPKCNVPKSEWDASVNACWDTYNLIPKEIVNTLYTPKVGPIPSPFARTPAMKPKRSAVRRNLFESEMLEVIKRFHS